MEMGLLELIKTLLEIAALIFLPVVAWLLKTVVSHNRKLDLLEQKVNAEINRRLEVMERKIDTFNNKIESKIDKLEHNINAKLIL
jgi:heme/copper-type cytochrome/quinol oxidase subunit 2